MTTMQSILSRLLHTGIGRWVITTFVKATQFRVFSSRTVHMMKFDILRLRARTFHPPSVRRATSVGKLHFGCGARRVPGWLNVDVGGSEFDVDLAAGHLPWFDSQFSTIVAQQVIEHLELGSELLPLLKELRRISKPNGEIWVSCPDLERVCDSYAQDKGQGLIDDWRTRYHKDIDLGMTGVPPQQMINYLFHQSGEHRNLLDFELLCWALQWSGFTSCQRANEEQFLKRFPEFPIRADDRYSLYVKGVAH